MTFTLTMQVTQYRVQRLRQAHSSNYFLYVGSLFKEDSSTSQCVGSNGRILTGNSRTGNDVEGSDKLI